MASVDNSLNGQTAVVTGSSSGIGRAIALELARAGADVLVHARQNRAGADEVAKRFVNLGRETKVVLADLSDQAAQDELVQAALGVARNRHLGEQRRGGRADG